MTAQYAPEWYVARRKGGKVRWQSRVTGAMTPWEDAHEMGPGSRYDEARDKLVGLLTR